MADTPTFNMLLTPWYFGNFQQRDPAPPSSCLLMAQRDCLKHCLGQHYLLWCLTQWTVCSPSVKFFSCWSLSTTLLLSQQRQKLGLSLGVGHPCRCLEQNPETHWEQSVGPAWLVCWFLTSTLLWSTTDDLLLTQPSLHCSVTAEMASREDNMQLR